MEEELRLGCGRGTDHLTCNEGFGTLTATALGGGGAAYEADPACCLEGGTGLTILRACGMFLAPVMEARAGQYKFKC